MTLMLNSPDLLTETPHRVSPSTRRAPDGVTVRPVPPSVGEPSGCRGKSQRHCRATVLADPAEDATATPGSGPPRRQGHRRHARHCRAAGGLAFGVDRTRASPWRLRQGPLEPLRGNAVGSFLDTLTVLPPRGAPAEQ